MTLSSFVVHTTVFSENIVNIFVKAIEDYYLNPVCDLIYIHMRKNNHVILAQPNFHEKTMNYISSPVIYNVDTAFSMFWKQFVYKTTISMSIDFN